MQQLVGTGLYPLRQAARLVGAQPRTVRRWLRGYSWKYKSGRSSSGALWKTQFASDAAAPQDSLPGEMVLGFRDLLELRMVAEFVGRDVPLKVIRATIEAAEKTLGEYPLSNRKFLTDGRRIFLEAIEELTGATKLLDVLGRQFVFSDVIKPSLYSGIVYDDGAASRWYPMPKRKAVVLDPQIQFGAPILADSGIPTDAIFDAWIAEGKDRTAVARMFEVSPAMVSAAVAFEQHLPAA